MVVMKFHNVDILYQIYYIFDMSSALACRVESINQVGFAAQQTLLYQRSFPHTHGTAGVW